MSLFYPGRSVFRTIPMFRRMMDEMFHDPFPYWTDASKGLSSEIMNDTSKFSVSLDVSSYKPEQLKVRVDGRILSVDGSQEEKSKDGLMQRSFSRKWVLPEDVDLEQIQSKLTDKGHLQIEAKKNPSATASRSIPINKSTEEKKE